MRCTPLGESAVLIETGLLPELAAPLVWQWVQALESGVLAGILEVVPCFTTVAVYYDAVQLGREWGTPPYARVCHWIKGRLATLIQVRPGERRQFTVPVCYGPEFGPDLEKVARATRMAPEAVVALHARGVYEVRAIGYSPGFPYFSGLPEELHLPRRATPRPRVEAGSVAIGGAQMGIYSLATPGGWNLIGRTPWLLFDPRADPPSLFKIGDQVKFEPIRPEVWAEIGSGPMAGRPFLSQRGSES